MYSDFTYFHWIAFFLCVQKLFSSLFATHRKLIIIEINFSGWRNETVIKIVSYFSDIWENGNDQRQGMKCYVNKTKQTYYCH